ncbi:MAG: serine/threonine-protein kinase, partial [Cyanobacteria bacterium J06649_4]
MLINNRYQVLRTLGEGGFGHAYLAEDTQMPSQRKCVIKQLKPITTSPEVYEVVKDRFQREAAILEQLGENHPQIPRLYAYFTEDQKFYLVQEWIEGQTLESVSLPMAEKAVLDIVLSLLPVLDFVHTSGIIHRDLKPDNIILRADTQQPVLIDFGAVRETMSTVMNSRQNPTSSIVIGTPGFMPSEQAAGRPIPSSDLYSLGLTAIYLLTGQMPQSLPSDPQTGELIWQQAASHVSPRLVAILDKAVRSHPRDRYSSAQQMLSALGTLPGVSVVTDATPTAPLPATVAPSASRVNTVAVSPAQNTPFAATSNATAQQLANAETQVSSPSSASVARQAMSNQTTHQAVSAQPWFKQLTPLTIGLAVLGIGGSAIAGGYMVSRLSADTSVEPAVSLPSSSTTVGTPAPDVDIDNEPDNDQAAERTLEGSATVTSGNRSVQV